MTERLTNHAFEDINDSIGQIAIVDESRCRQDLGSVR